MMTEFSRQKVEGIPDRVMVKWSREVLEEGFVAFPKRLLRCLSDVFEGPRALDHLRAALTIADYRRPNQFEGPKLAYLAFVAGVSKQRFKGMLEELQASGLLLMEESSDRLNLSLDPLLKKIMQATADKG